MFWTIIFGFAVFIVLAIVIYLLPSDPPVAAVKKKPKKEAPSPEPVVIDKHKDWKSIAERWEKLNHNLQTDIENLRTDQAQLQKAVNQEKAVSRDLTEKLGLEKGWREKEQAGLEKFKAHEKALKDQVFRTESDLEKEHSNRLRLESQLQEIKIRHDQAIDEKRQLSIKASSQQTTIEAHAKEIRELKKENALLKEKREDIQWVAKSEFDDLKKVLAAKEAELARLKQTRV
ncbi:MAG: hypothetical protein HQL13_03285 [Candidatus Omnitrophica bacterium]|nr:hypothetical protein [Candidatus Omnitrophota bacterium]